MKNTHKFTLIFICSLLLAVVSAKAQDPMKAAPNNYKKVLLDNDHVRVLEASIMPGEEVPFHSHPNHVAYVVAGGKLEITPKGKKSEVFEMAAGQAVFLDAVTHMAKNVGDTEIKVIVTEIKEKKKM